MKYLKIYEGYEYLSDEDFENLKSHIEPIIVKIIDDKIEKLSIKDYIKWAFSYKPMIEDFFDSGFFNELYSYSHNTFDNVSTPKIYNSFIRILDEVSPRYYMRIANKLVKLFEENPDDYRENYEIYNDEISSYVKNKLEWLLDTDKYNL